MYKLSIKWGKKTIGIYDTLPEAEQAALRYSFEHNFGYHDNAYYTYEKVTE